MSVHSILREPGSQRWLEFRNPCAVIETTQLDEVRPCLELIQREVESQGLHAVGFVAYEAAPAFDRALTTRASEGVPLVWFGLFPPPKAIESLAAPQSFSSLLPCDLQEWQPSIDQAGYEATIDGIREAIARGETYQVNYTFRLRQTLPADKSPGEYAAAMFARMAATQPSPYAALVETDELVIASASPELFFELDDDTIITRPMKGTTPRGLSCADDIAASRQLTASEKNRAENAMIVDMMRNDLGRVAHKGTVLVSDLFQVDRYPTLWQMTSSVTAQTGASLYEIFAALFPCASITGAPKASTMGIIARCETSPRHIYTGAIGHIAPERKAIFSVAIRTVVVDKRKLLAEYGIGGGVVWDSTPQGEYLESLLKAAILASPPPEFSLLETILHTPGEGYYLLDYHLRRLNQSAEYFGFEPPITPSQTLAAFANSLPDEPQRVRLLVSRTGQCTCESRPLSDDDPPDPMLLELAAEPINAADPFLYHKTTNRDVYAKALAACRVGHDVLLYNARGEVTETCRANIAVRVGSDLVTPPVSSGLLPGVLRQYLLDEGKLIERVVTLDMLADCDELFVVNSVRRWRRATLVGGDARSLYQELNGKSERGVQIADDHSER
jgi:para-aminobenzoate synthetase/4-amino-4-deoxychorismate lyase